MSRHDPSKEELAKILKSSTKEFKPSFEPILGFHYNEIDRYSLEEQIQYFGSLEKLGIVSSRPVESIIKCKRCNFHSFDIRLVCTSCRSSNIVYGTVIEHDLCGNVDFDNKYIELDGILVCTKCNKKLKAIGVDYSKPGYFYKCLECKSLLPDIERDYICLKCGESSIEYELDLLQLHAFTINREKLAEVLNHPSRTQSLVEQLNKVGIKSTLSGSIVGVSQIRHTFDLVVYNDKNVPTLVMDVIQPDQSDQKKEDHLLRFIAECIDTNISNKVILAIPNLKSDLKSLINLNGGIVIESQTIDDAILEIVATISQLLGLEQFN